jgi:hypothetical protein
VNNSESERGLSNGNAIAAKYAKLPPLESISNKHTNGNPSTSEFMIKKIRT